MAKRNRREKLEIEDLGEIELTAEQAAEAERQIELADKEDDGVSLRWERDTPTD